MADTIVTNLSATPLGLYDVDGAYHVVGAMGGSAVIDPDVPSAEIIGIYASSGQATAIVGDAPANTAAPVASGTLDVGDTVSVTDGTWTGTPTPTLTYQWQVSDGEDWQDIESATSSDLELVVDFVGEDVRCVVTGTNSIGSDTATSNPLGPVTAEE